MHIYLVEDAKTKIHLVSSIFHFFKFKLFSKQTFHLVPSLAPFGSYLALMCTSISGGGCSNWARDKMLKTTGRLYLTNESRKEHGCRVQWTEWSNG